MAIATGTALLGGAMLGSAALGSRAAKKAASTQAQAAREGMDAQERMFERQLELQEPFRQGGLEAQNMLMRELRNPQQYRPTGSANAMSTPQRRTTGGGILGAARSAARGGLLPAGIDPRAAAADPEHTVAVPNSPLSQIGEAVIREVLGGELISEHPVDEAGDR
jgi:hypothetical protein